MFTEIQWQMSQQQFCCLLFYKKTLLLFFFRFDCLVDLVTFFFCLRGVSFFFFFLKGCSIECSNRNIMLFWWSKILSTSYYEPRSAKPCQSSAWKASFLPVSVQFAHPPNHMVVVLNLHVSSRSRYQAPRRHIWFTHLIVAICLFICLFQPSGYI